MLGFILGIITLGLVAVIPTGHVGVKTNFGAVRDVLQPGIHIKMPLGIESVHQLDTRVQKDDVKAEAGSKDLQTVNTDVVVNYHITANKAGKSYQDIGDNIAI